MLICAYCAYSALCSGINFHVRWEKDCVHRWIREAIARIGKAPFLSLFLFLSSHFRHTSLFTMNDKSRQSPPLRRKNSYVNHSLDYSHHWLPDSAWQKCFAMRGRKSAVSRAMLLRSFSLSLRSGDAYVINHSWSASSCTFRRNSSLSLISLNAATGVSRRVHSLYNRYRIAFHSPLFYQNERERVR